MRTLKNRMVLASLVGLALSACATVTVDGNATPAQIKAAKLQANFDQACVYLKGASATATPLIPLIEQKIGKNGMLAVQAAQVAIKQTCGKPLDLSKADEITQRMFDIGGELIAIVVKAQSAPPT